MTCNFIVIGRQDILLNDLEAKWSNLKIIKIMKFSRVRQFYNNLTINSLTSSKDFTAAPSCWTKYVCIVLRLNLNCASNLWSISSEIVRPLCLMKRGPFRSEFLVFASFSKMFTLLFLCSLKEGAKNILKHGWWSHLKKVSLWQSFVLERLTVIFSDLPGHVSLGN